jgi:hypothetical protein
MEQLLILLLFNTIELAPHTAQAVSTSQNASSAAGLPHSIHLDILLFTVSFR